MDDISLTSGMVVLALVFVDALITLGYAALNEADLNEDRHDHTEQLRRQFALGGQISLVLVRLTMASLAVEGVVIPLAARTPNVPLIGIYMAVLLPLALLLVVLGEIVPSVLGRTYADQIAQSMRLPMSLVVVILRPLIWLANGLSSLILAVFGAKQGRTSVTEEQFLRLMDNDQILEDNERKMIHSVMQLDETTVSEMMVPRIDITAVDKGTSIAAARQVFLEGGHSRMPVYNGNIDHVVGVVYVKDLLEVWHNGDTVVGSVEEIMRPAHFVPEAMTGDELLRFFQRNKVHLVIVLEDYGGTGGLVTLEDLLEEIVGDIQDEYDEDEFDEVIPIGENEYRIDAGVSLYELDEMLGINIEDDEVDTLGGYIFKLLDRVPTLDEFILTDTIELKILSLEGRRIRSVYLRKLSSISDMDGDDRPRHDPQPGETRDPQPETADS